MVVEGGNFRRQEENSHQDVSGVGWYEVSLRHMLSLQVREKTVQRVGESEGALAGEAGGQAEGQTGQSGQGWGSERGQTGDPRRQRPLGP